LAINDELKKAFGPLWDIYNDENVREIIVDSCDDIYYEKNGEIINFEPGLKDTNEIKQMIFSFLKIAGKDITPEIKQLHFSFDKNTHITAVLPPLSFNGPAFNLMKMSSQKITWDDLIKWKAITQEGRDLIQEMIENNKNILIGGGVAGGKTTLANLCVNTINEKYRIVTMERVANLFFERKRLVRLEAPNHEKNEMVDLIKAASHMRADYLILNEIEGPEAMNFIELLRDGLSGMAVIRASNIFDCLKRLEIKAMSSNIIENVEEVRFAISEAFHYVLFQERLSDGRRVISGIGEVKYHSGTLTCEIIYKFK